MLTTILFDIDGTLIHARGAGMQAIRRSMEELFQVRTLPRVRVHGRTDFGILSELFEHLNLDYAQHQDQFHETYLRHLPATLSASKGTILPGIPSLLPMLVDRSDVSLGLLTGNGHQAAMVKLAHFGLEEFFPFGGFGDLHGDRDDVARTAVQSAALHLGGQFWPERVWVIGDTPDDIRCGRAVGARVLAVETGGTDRQVLAESGPDVLMKDLSDIEYFLESVVAG